jgi:hypothetical protein
MNDDKGKDCNYLGSGDYTEKAGVGGSTPSLATIHSKELSGIASCLPSPLSVRYFSTRSGSVPGYDDGEGLKLELPLAQSAFSPLLSAAWLKIAPGLRITLRFWFGQR